MTDITSSFWWVFYGHLVNLDCSRFSDFIILSRRPHLIFVKSRACMERISQLLLHFISLLLDNLGITLIEGIRMLIFLCLIVIHWLHRWISLKIVKVLSHQTLVTFILCISRVKISDVRFCRINLVWLQSSKPVTIWTHQVILLRFLSSSNKLCHWFWERIPPLLACSLNLVLLVELIFLDGIVEERSLLCHLSVLWACQIKATQIKLLCLRGSFLDTPSLLIERY